ncbi:hypothetical protein [Alishewanella aestuarii]|nr:hypothetical protein [Alishewanella aestuarii]
MKKTLLLGLGITLSALTLLGCGQKVDGIKSEFAERIDSTEKHSFTGYTVIVTESSIKKANEFEEKNSLGFDTGVDENGHLKTLNKVSFKNDEFRKIEEIRKVYESELAALRTRVQSNIDVEAKRINGNITKLQGERETLQERMISYNAATANELALHEQARSKHQGIERKMSERKEKFYEEFKKIVLESNLPIDVNSRPEPRNFYRSYALKNNAPCDNRIEVMSNRGTPVAYCVEARIDQSQIALAPALISYGMDYEKLQSERRQANQEVSTTQKALSDARIIASNRLSINPTRIEREIANLDRQINTERASLESATNFTSQFNRANYNDRKLNETANNYRRAILDYARSVKVEAFLKSGYNIDKFSDENDKPKLSEKDKGMVIYVFTNKNNKQYVFLTPVNSRSNKTYGEIFENDVVPRSFDFNISKNKDVLNVVKGII